MDNDLISRSRLRMNFIQAVEDENPKLYGEIILDLIDMQPTVKQPQGEWIPVSERLPERYKKVIVTDIETKDTYCSWYYENGYWDCYDGVLKNRIIAWQPLPEPYKKQD